MRKGAQIKGDCRGTDNCTNGRGIPGVVDGVKSKGIETESDVKARKQMLRKFVYKL